jgi:N-hydroxyarylamine O-acetyltransferase
MWMANLGLDAYLERIQWTGPLRPDYDTLAGLLRAHTRHIPFENLDVLAGRGINIELPAVEAKLVGARRGGYCFEQATLFAAVLEALEFAVVRHCARVTLMVPRTAAPRTHMFLLVSLAEGDFVVDPGFGPLLPRVPLRLGGEEEARFHRESHRMVQEGRYWILRGSLGEDPVDAWVTTFDEENTVDFVLGNHYTSTHPSSAFVNRIMMSALTDEGRVTIMNRNVTVRDRAGAATFELADRKALRELVAKYFGFDLPEIETLRVPSIPEWN